MWRREDASLKYICSLGTFFPLNLAAIKLPCVDAAACTCLLGWVPLSCLWKKWLLFRWVPFSSWPSHIKCAYILSVVALCEITRFQNNNKKYTFLPVMLSRFAHSKVWTMHFPAETILAQQLGTSSFWWIQYSSADVCAILWCSIKRNLCTGRIASTIGNGSGSSLEMIFALIICL